MKFDVILSKVPENFFLDTFFTSCLLSRVWAGKTLIFGKNSVKKTDVLLTEVKYKESNPNKNLFLSVLNSWFFTACFKLHWISHEVDGDSLELAVELLGSVVLGASARIRFVKSIKWWLIGVRPKFLKSISCQNLLSQNLLCQNLLNYSIKLLAEEIK